MTIDSHQHFWRYTLAEYPWMKPEWPIRRDFLPPDLAREMANVGLDGCVAVQAQQTVAEARWLLSLADAHPIIKGVVGWVDLQSERVEEELAELAQHPRFVGVRHVVQDEPDDNFLLRPAFQRGVGKLQGVAVHGQSAFQHRARKRGDVHFVRSVGQAQRARAGVGLGEEVIL